MTEITKYEGPFESTWLQGYVTCSYARLVEVFGEPDRGDGHKVDAEWDLMTPRGHATIYNYKDGPAYLGNAGTPVAQITDWHIGGTTKEVVTAIQVAVSR